MVDNRFDPKPMMLQGNLVRLEPLTLDHAPGLLNIAQDESIWQFFAMDAPRVLDEAEQWIKGRLSDQEAGQRLPFAVISLADGEFAGSTGYSEINKTNRTIAIASWYGVKYQRTGVNTECKYMLLKYAFEEFGAFRVSLNVDVKNMRSRRAVERIGGVQEGLLRKQRIRKDGTHRDTVIYGFTDDDWPRVKERLEGFMER
tara:strand:+ start:335 stop:934 length:600 start_codon:yes stop_codon:yes gene_type:complete